MQFHRRLLTTALAIGLPFAAAAETITLRTPETAGICGYRKMWDQPVTTGADGLRVIIEPLDKDYAIKDRGGVAPWATPTLEAAGKPAALAFDAIHRTLLVRFPDAAEKIAAKVNEGNKIAKLELVLPFADEELWPEGGGFSPPAPPPGYGYHYRANWGIEWGYRVVRPRWHAVAWALKKPWTADAELGPTYNAHINGAGYWAHFGAQDDGADRLPKPFGPAEVSYQQTEGRLDLTSLLADESYGKTLAERLRTLADCGVALKKWETYDHLYYDGSPYEWGTGVGGRAIIIQPPKLVVTFAKDDKAERVAKLPPAADIAALAGILRKGTGGKPTAVMPTPDEIRALAERFQPRRPDWMPDWQWQRVEELLKARAGTHPDDPFWTPFLSPMQIRGLRAPADGEAVGPLDLVRSYETWVDLYLQRPYRGYHGHATISGLIVPWFEYREALPAPVREWFHEYLVSYLMPDRPTADTHEKRFDRNYVEGPLVHPMVDTTALGAPAEAQPVISSRKFDSYVAKTGYWRGNKTWYRSGFNYTISTFNFNANAALAALVGGGIIGSDYAMADGRNGQMDYVSKLFTWFDGSTQEEGDDYYFPMTVKASKLVADYGPEPFDRLLARSQLAKHMTMLADTYHPGLRRYVTGASRTGLHCRLGNQDGLYAMLHSMSKTGALTDLGAETVLDGLAKWGHDTPPDEVARQALVSPFAPLWYQEIIDNKPLPFETTATFKIWGHQAQRPVMRRSYLGHNFGLYSANAPAGFISITGHWRRRDQAPESFHDVGTMLARFGVVSDNRPGGQTWFPEMSPGTGWIRPYGVQATLQSGPRMIIAASPLRLDSGYRINAIQSSIAFYNYETPEPTWEIYIDGQRQEGLPIKAKAGQRIAIRDGVTYIGIIPLPSTDLGRTDEVVLHAGVKQYNVTAALVIDNLMHQGEFVWPPDPAKELPQEGTDWEAIDRACGGFIVEFGDAISHQSFDAFQAMLREATFETSFDPEQALHEIRYRTGDDVLEMGVYTTYDGSKGLTNPESSLDRLFAYQRVNGRDAYDVVSGQREAVDAVGDADPVRGIVNIPAGEYVDRDSPFSQQATTGRIEKGGAVLTTTPGRMAMLQHEPNARIVSAWNPLPDLNEFALDLPGGGRIVANGRIGLGCVTVNLSVNTVTVDHAFHGDQAKQPGVATALHAFELPKETKITVNGKALADLKTLEIDGRPATVIPLTTAVTP